MESKLLVFIKDPNAPMRKDGPSETTQWPKVVSISDDRNRIKEISMEERCAENEKIILQNARHNDLPHKLCPLHGLVRDDGEHASCRASSVPWWARHDS